MAATLLDSQTVQIALLGGGVYLLYTFSSTFSEVNELTNTAVTGVKDYIDDTEGLAPAFASIPGAKMGLASGDQRPGMKMIDQIQKEADSGNGIAKIMVDLAGGPVKPRVPYGPNPPISDGSYGDQTDPLLYKYRVWMDCTQIEDRESLISFSVAHKAAGIDPFKFAAKTLPSFNDAHVGQYNDVTWADNHPPPQPNAHYVEHGTWSESWMSGPEITWTNRDSYTYFGENLKNDVDMSPMIRDPANPDKWYHFGLAGALDDAQQGGVNWRRAKTDAGARASVIEYLDSLELPSQYLEPMPNSSECQFLKYYGIAWKVNTATGTEAQKAVGWKGYLTFSAAV